MVAILIARSDTIRGQKLYFHYLQFACNFILRYICMYYVYTNFSLCPNQERLGAEGIAKARAPLKEGRRRGRGPEDPSEAVEERLLDP